MNEAEQERKKLIGRAGVVGLGTLASRILGLGRDMALAAIFRRDQTDAFFVAFTIPNALRQLLGEGAVSSAVVPVLSAKVAGEGESAAREFFAKIRGVSIAALLLVSLLGVLCARPLTHLFASGYTGAQLERTVLLTRIVFPYLFFAGTTALGMAALQTRRRFGVAAFAPGLLNVAFIAAAFLLPGPLRMAGVDVAVAMAAGAIAGGILQVAFQWPSVRREGFGSRPQLDLADPGVREVGRRLLPMTLGIGVYYIDLVLSRRFLSELGEGAQSFFTWASRICDFPQGIFVMAISTAALPSLAGLAAKGERGEFAKTFSLGVRLSLFISIPASVLLAFFSEPLVVMFFQRGAFDALASRETARALAWQGAAIWCVSVVRQLVAAFYALGDTRTPVVVSLFDLLVFIALAVSLRGPFGHAGISMAVAGSSAAQMLLLMLSLAYKHPGAMLWREVARSALGILIACVAFVGVVTILDRAVGPMPAIARGVVVVLVSALVFLVASWGMKSRELGELGRAVRRRRSP